MTEIKTTITRVTIFRGQARVERNAKIDLPAGLSFLSFCDLPASLIPASIRVKASADQPSFLRDTSIEEVYHTATYDQKLNALEKESRQLKEKIENLEDEITALDGTIKHLESLLGESRVFAFSISSGKLSLAEHQKIYTSVSEERKRTFEKKQAISTKIADLNYLLAKNLAEQDQIRSGEQKTTYTVTTRLELQAAGSIFIELVYLTHNAHWTPHYDLQLVGNTVTLDYLADVSQTTGENWDEIELNLSTAEPGTHSRIPKLEPWYVDAYRPPVRMMQSALNAVAMKKGDMAMPLSMDQFARDAYTEAMIPEAEVIEQGVNLKYKIPYKVSINSIHETLVVKIAACELKPEIDLVVAPRKETRALTRIKTKNSTPFTLLPGNVQLYDNGEYSGKTEIKLIPKGGEILASLGFDDHVQVEFELLRSEINKKTLQDKKKSTYSYQVRLTNNSLDQRSIEVMDQVPVSKHEQIKVKLEETYPSNVTVDELNRLSWKIVLGPQKSEVLRYTFTVESPVDIQVSGL